MVAGLGEEDVRRLDVAVDEAGAVRGVERAADLLGDPKRLHGRQRPRSLSSACRLGPLT